MEDVLKTALVCAIALGSASPLMAAAYRCSGQDGKISFQDRPCVAGEAKELPGISSQATPANPPLTSPANTPSQRTRVSVPWTPTVQDRTSQPQLSEASLKAKVAATLKDPDSAKFDGVQLVWSGRALCGVVNARNSYGAYSGPKSFVADNQGVYWSGDGSAIVDVGRFESRNTYYAKAHFWGCLP